ncbi:GGDEF domain-containing protein [Bacillus sp. M6-12]|uniref:GGDEF domain-containing protein n=1 Tax=Bacillus sp. M6-12 TaxID=2054166 RepID=UPI0015E0A57A|nr:GGDEF domain-containing protein [Bacillus sp. M6-12]
MIKDYIGCLGLIVAFILAAGHVQKAGRYGSGLTVYKQVQFGVVYGLLGGGLTLFAFSLPEGGAIDIAYVAALLAAWNGRAVSLCITFFIMFLYQLMIAESISGNEIISLSVLTVFLVSLIQFRFSERVYFILAILGGSAIYTGLSQHGAQDMSFEAFFYSVAGGIHAYFIHHFSRKDVELFRSYQKEATTDFLTGVQNVRQFDRSLNSFVKSALLRNEPLSLLLIDIDHFKKINDTYGHITGDFVLKEAAKVLTNKLSSGDFLSRNGGEEFAVMLPGYDHAKALQVAEALRQSIEETIFHYDYTLKIQITISIGAATLDETVFSSDDLIIQADSALYSAKHAGRNIVCSKFKCIACGNNPCSGQCQYPLTK